MTVRGEDGVKARVATEQRIPIGPVHTREIAQDAS
jgi:hypothetical protein